MNIIKITSKLSGMLAITTLIIPASSAQIVYQNDFSSAPTVVDVAGNTSPRIHNDFTMPGSGAHTFVESNFANFTVSGGDLTFTSGDQGTLWLLINTQTWATGDYTVSFDGQVTSGDTMYWDVIGGNTAASTELGIRFWTNQTRPYIRNAGAGTAERLGQINLAGDTAGTALQEVAAASFTDTSLTSQSLTITLTADHVGSANDYVLVGWNNTGGNGTATIDNIEVALVPEPSTFALLGLGLGALCFLRRRPA